MMEVTKLLEDSNERLVGIYGGAGVGKTTFVRKVAEDARDKKLFDTIIMVNVTKVPDIKRIQGQIADMLGLKLEGESEEARAMSIQERLKNDKDNILIILDDLCAKLDLNALGIPLKTNEESSALVVPNKKETGKQYPNEAKKKESTAAADDTISTKAKTIFNDSSKMKEQSRGYKILLISELRQVLTEMDVKAASIFSISLLNSNEAKALFKETAAIAYKNSDELTKYAPDQIADKCNGLPMLIVTTARALKNQKNHLFWKDILEKLAKYAAENPNAAPEYSTKLSYGLLENEELKLTFLLCARMDNDALVADLVRYCIGLGFLQGVYSVWEVRDRVQMLLATLKDAGLLSDSYSSNRFTMPNLVRNAALLISSEERHVFTMTEGKFDEWPSKDELKRCTVISLRHCDFIREFPSSIKCPTLRVFHIENNDPSLKIPESFFQEMEELRVLILIGVNLSQLPSSIKCLTNLRMLCLEQCILGEKLEIIGELTNLRILSFAGSDIKSLPNKPNLLSKLQVFDISNCFNLRMIPYCAMSSLTRLEELYMRNIPFQWKVHDGKQKNQSENASLSVLGDLNQLTNLDLQIPSAKHLPKNLFFDKLYSYKIIIGSLKRGLEVDFKIPDKYELSRCLAICQKDGSFDIHSQEAIKMLFERVEILLLENLNGVQDVFYELNLKGFPYLKRLSIASNKSIRSLVTQKRKQFENVFPKLESLYLCKLRKIEKIFSCQSLSNGSFGNLKIIKIKLCSSLKNVFLISMVKFLTALETVKISECNSLEEIVVSETNNQNETDSTKFLKLRSLTLQSLSKFIGFCPISFEEDTRSLFHNKIEVPELERIELSMLPIKHIWSDQILACHTHTVEKRTCHQKLMRHFGKKHHFPKQTYSPFQSLVHLEVNGCWNLESLWSFSIATHLVNLQSLFVTDCKITHIFPQDQGGGQAKTNKDAIFPNLKTVKLSGMKSLCKIWDSEAPVNSFGKLNTLIIDKCDELVNLIPHNMATRLSNLSCLRVTNCESIKVIFEEADDDKMQGSVLQDIHLEALPKLENVFKWKKQVKWSDLKLQKIWVHDCKRLENIFSVSVVESAKINIESLVISDCSQLREIVCKKGEDAAVINTSSPIKFEFPKLTTIKLLKLSKFKSFYSSGAYELSCPVLTDLSIESCDLLEPFEGTSSSIAKRKNILFPEKEKEVINNKLKSMQIELRHIVGSSSTGYEYDYRRDNLEELRLSKQKNTDVIHSFLHCNPNLKSLCLNDCYFEELELGGTRRPAVGVVPKLKSLTLTNSYSPNKICFEEDTVLQRIESLIINHVWGLDTIAPSSVSLAHLSILEVVDCWSLKYVISASTAKSMGQLKTMKVINCGSLEEIVSEEETREGKIIFKQLTTLELVSLEMLDSFCGSKNCAFEFPSLENCIVSGCPKMEVFSAHEVHCAPNLQKIYYARDKDKKRWCWQDDINSTIKYIYHNKKFKEGMHELEVYSPGEDDPLISIWSSKEGPRRDWFSDLKTLKLSRCDALHKRYAVPSNVLRCLKSLQELHVQSCNTIECIFEMDESIKSKGSSFQLKNLTLMGLSNLKSVWQQQHDKPEILPGFQNLQHVTIYSCEKLTSVFPAALARDLKKLQELDIWNCDRLKEIVGNEKEAVEGLDKFVFPHLTSLSLSALPQLTDYNSGNFTLECPELKKLLLFPNQQQKYPEGISKSKVKELWLNPNHSLAQQFMNEGGFHQALNELYLDSYLDSRENSSLQLEILADDKTPPNLEIIEIHYNKHCKTINIPEEVGKRMHELKELKLDTLSELDSISGLEYLLKLQLLHLHQCPKLTTLGQSCSNNLKELYIEDCDGLQCLLTSSAAKMLIHLEELKVEFCKSLKDIVGKEEESGTEDDIVEFKRLERLTLKHLKSLGCFYSGNATLNFPSLIRVEIQYCLEMKTFSQGPIYVETPFRVFYQDVAENKDYWSFLSDLNVTTACQFLLPQERLDLGDHPELKDLWLGNIPMPEGFYSAFKLRHLVVEGCEDFFSTTILPSHLLPFLVNLEELEVRKCNSVEVIFEVTDTPTNNNVVIPLKKLTLEYLPNLKKVWNKDPKGSIISLPCLEEVVVNGCQSIRSLFPESVAKGNLHKLEVRYCDKLVEIVTKDEAATHETNHKELIVFPKLTSLTLHYLPNLTYIFGGGPKIINLPKLQELEIYGANSIDSALKVVTPQLAKLSVDKEGVILLEKGVLHFDHKRISYLKLQGFNDIESEAFSTDVFSKFQLSNVEEFVVSNSAFKEIIFPSKKPESIGLEHGLMGFFQNIESFTNLVSSATVLSFSSLTCLKVEDCPSLKYLITSSTVKSLVNLLELYISNCEALETVVAYQPHHDDVITFKELKKLSLSKLPKLESLYTPNSTLKFPSLGEVMVSECNRLEYLFSFSAAKSLHNLYKMEVSKCESLETVVVVATQEADAPHEGLTFPKLWKLSLSELPKLESFFHGKSSLKLPSYRVEVSISLCKSMKTFSHGDVKAANLWKVEIDGVLCSTDNLNTAVSQQFENRMKQH
ncbi:hypothetical protein PIB30_015687 [Stylosanthes scabra]|uniref:AAA+ ATPase domain-containing protein n=1 Tax=Stylosanthes scabra TaxID=79078 RepID=A0ABU6UA71_9FABA|nr:hypothetical protein [Stylosanthes scabra]